MRSSQIAVQLFIEIALIKAVHRGRRDGEVGEGGGISSSAHKLNGAKKFLPDEGIPTTGMCQTCQHHHQPNSNLALYYKCLQCTLAH